MESGKGSSDPLFGLHKGHGVRGKLARVLDRSGLGNAWRIEKSDSDLLRRAKVIYRLDAVFDYLAEADERTALPALYNTVADLKMANLDYQQRMDQIQRLNPGRAFSNRTLQRMRLEFAQRIGPTLGRDAPPFNEEILAKVLRREQRFAAELLAANRSDKFSEQVRRGYDAPMSAPIAAFLQLPVFVPRTSDRGLIVGRTARHGDWVCVFSTEQQLSAHPVATRLAGHTMAAGAEVVREVAGRWRTVGIVVDPPAVRSTGDAAAYPSALHMPADLLPTLL